MVQDHEDGTYWRIVLADTFERAFKDEWLFEHVGWNRQVQERTRPAENHRRIPADMLLDGSYFELVNFDLHEHRLVPKPIDGQHIDGFTRDLFENLIRRGDVFADKNMRYRVRSYNWVQLSVEVARAFPFPLERTTIMSSRALLTKYAYQP